MTTVNSHIVCTTALKEVEAINYLLHDHDYYSKTILSSTIQIPSQEEQKLNSSDQYESCQKVHAEKVEFKSTIDTEKKYCMGTSSHSPQQMEFAKLGVSRLPKKMEDKIKTDSSTSPDTKKSSSIALRQNILASSSEPLLAPCDIEKDEIKETQVDEGTKITCHICSKQLKNRKTKSLHLRIMHGVNAKGNVVLRPVKEKVFCVFCNKKYCNAFSLQRHIKTVHHSDNNKLYSCVKCHYKTLRKDNLLKHISIVKHKNVTSKNVPSIESKKKIKCPQCNKQYTQQKCLNMHSKKVHGICNTNFTICRKCPLCSFSSNMFLKTDMHRHFEDVHGVSMKWEHHEFNSVDEFENWKEEIEKTTSTSYVQSKTLSRGLFTYQCNRCGTYKPKGKGLRHIKLKGSCKINSFCPSEMKVKHIGELIEVKYQSQHIGHENQLEYTRLSLQDRKSIAQMLMNKVPKKEILRSVRASSVNKELQRLHLISAADISNIKNSLKMSSAALDTNSTFELDEMLKNNTILEEGKDSENGGFVIEKNRLIEELKAMIAALEPKLYCKERVEFLKKEMNKINKVAEGICSTEGQEMEVQSFPRTSTKILQQRKFVSTKKRKTPKKNNINNSEQISDVRLQSPNQ